MGRVRELAQRLLVLRFLPVFASRNDSIRFVSHTVQSSLSVFTHSLLVIYAKNLDNCYGKVTVLFVFVDL